MNEFDEMLAVLEQKQEQLKDEIDSFQTQRAEVLELALSTDDDMPLVPVKPVKLKLSQPAAKRPVGRPKKSIIPPIREALVIPQVPKDLQSEEIIFPNPANNDPNAIPKGICNFLARNPAKLSEIVKHTIEAGLFQSDPSIATATVRKILEEMCGSATVRIVGEMDDLPLYAIKK